jgi:hypothetical protein
LLVVMLVLVGVVLPSAGSGTASAAERGIPAAAEGAGPSALDQAQAGRLVAVQQLAPSSVTAVVECTDTGCPTAPTDLDYCVERADFCVYYTTDSISETQAEWAADIVEMYWNRFVSLDFDEPKHSGKLEVHLLDIPGDCNGGTSWSSNAISTYAGCFVNDELAQKVLGHELTHRVQYNHDDGGTAPVQTKFLKEGTARATEDNWFTEIDHWAAALSYSSFNTEVNNYLVAAINDITSYAMRYRSCLWWKYAMEQYGSDPDEPELGIDFVLDVYEQNRLGYSSIGAVNRALVGAGVTFDDVFKQFAVANWTKDLTGVPNDSYNYHDEDEAGNPGSYGPLAPNSGGTINVATAAEWDNQWTDRYGIRYFEADIGSPCSVISVSFGHDSGPAFYHIVTQNGTAFNTHMQRSGGDWKQAFLNDGVTKVVAIAGSLGSASQVDVALGCANPVLEIKMPNSGAVARTQPGDKFLVQVLVSDGAGGPVVAGLGNSDFTVTVGGESASVIGGGFIQEQYWLLVEAPDLPDDTYDLDVTLETTSASDTSENSVVYTEDRTDQVLIIDRSGSMGVDDRLVAAKDAASFYVDVTRNHDGLAVVPYRGIVDPEPWHMQEIFGASERTSAKDYINYDLSAGGMTSIGAGLLEAVKELKDSTTDNPLCSFVLLSDGMENSEPMWADAEVHDAVLGTGCPVTTIAFGPESDETLMQQIATETGGLYFYNDVFVSSPTAGVRATPTMADADLALANTYEYAEGLGEGRQRLLAEKGVLTRAVPEAKHEVYVDETLSEAVFSLDWYAGSSPGPGNDNMELELVDPSGDSFNAIIPGYSFEDLLSKHVGFRLQGEDLEPGDWTLYVRLVDLESESLPYQVTVSGQTWITLHLLLPDRMGLKYTTGNSVPIYAILTADGPVSDALVEAFVTAPDGTETRVMLADDGQHDDGMPGDGLYAGLYTLVTQANLVEPLGEEPLGDLSDNGVYPQGEEAEIEVKDEGGYRVLVRATHEKFTREAMGGFAVLEGWDGDGDRIPDVWERENDVDLWGDDPDGDGLVNGDEYLNGTDPHDPDTDDGGEKDGSEVTHGRDPLDPADDEIRAPSFFQVRPVLHRPVGGLEREPAVLLHYDWRVEYDQMWWYRATSPDGPWGEPSGRLDSSGYFTDTNVAAGTEYWYLFEATMEVMRAEPAVSTVLASQAVTPAEDPYPPEALVLINGGAPSTKNPFVTLSFVPYEMEGDNPEEVFGDITWMKISNDPYFDDDDWLPFEEPVPWRLDGYPEEIASVYVLFRDDAGNESIAPEVGVILYLPETIYLPVVLRAN